MKFKFKMEGVFLALIALLLKLECGSTVYTTNDNPANTIGFGYALEMFYTAFQKVMSCGYPPYQLPVLAPYRNAFWNFNYTNDYHRFVGNLSNTVITGLSNFIVLAGDYNSSTQHTTFDVVFPDVQILGEYVVDAYAFLAGYPTYMSGEGSLDVRLIDARMIGDFALQDSPYDPQSLRISDFHLNFYLADIEVNNWNKLWDISTNNFINDWIRSFSLMWTQQIQNSVSNIYAQLLLPNINGYLNGMNMTQLIDFFISQAQAFNMAQCTLS